MIEYIGWPLPIFHLLFRFIWHMLNSSWHNVNGHSFCCGLVLSGLRDMQIQNSEWIWAKFTQFIAFLSSRDIYDFCQGSAQKMNSKWEKQKKNRFFFLKRMNSLFCIFITSTDGFIASHLTCFIWMNMKREKSLTQRL